MGKRTIEKHIKYNSEEYEIVKSRAEQMQLRPGTYIRKISVQGQIINYDLSALNELRVQFYRIGNNINQVTSMINSTKQIYQNDLEQLSVKMAEMEKAMNDLIKKFEMQNNLTR